MGLNEFTKSVRFANEKHRVSVNVLCTAYWLKDHFIAAIKPHGITMEQYNVMRILHGAQPYKMRAKDIASRMMEKSSNVPRIIDKLVTKELARRLSSNRDKRSKFIALTDEGISVIEHAQISIEQTAKRVLKIADLDAKKINEILEKIKRGSV